MFLSLPWSFQAVLDVDLRVSGVNLFYLGMLDGKYVYIYDYLLRKFGFKGKGN